MAQGSWTEQGVDRVLDGFNREERKASEMASGDWGGLGVVPENDEMTNDEDTIREPRDRSSHMVPRGHAWMDRGTAGRVGIGRGASDGDRTALGVSSLVAALPLDGRDDKDLAEMEDAPEDCAPALWREVFDRQVDLEVAGVVGTFCCYLAGEQYSEHCVVVCLHGGGHSALSWGLVAASLKDVCTVLAYDARGHGGSSAAPEHDLSAERQVQDCVEILKALFNSDPAKLPPIAVVGHSMGGAVAVRLSSSRSLPTMRALAVIDVVEGTAIAALPYMQSFLMGRPRSFSSLDKAIRYVVRAGQLKNLKSAKLSVPPQLFFSETTGRYLWRTDLEASEKYWRGWFQGLSTEFLSAPVAKLLILAGSDRLDKDLTIAQMQGKFQTILMPGAGHSVHEDQPERTAQTIIDFLRRNRIISCGEDAFPLKIFQQRGPLPPCC